MTRWAALTVAALAFCVAATANSGGYRYGVSDQAFYATAVVKDVHPSFFPRDTPLLETQSRLQLSDEILATLSSATGVDLPPLFFAVYLLTLVVLFAGSVAFARAMGFSWWATSAFLVLLTFRHRIAKTGANSLEGYTHPRQLAFGLGVMALAAFLRGSTAWTAVCLGLAACWHPTTAFWFALVLGIATITAYRRAWPWLAGATAALAMVAVLAVSVGPLSGRLITMDADWLKVLAEKDYLFPHEWPPYAWALNCGYGLIIALIFRSRRQMARTVPRENALVAGWLALLPVFVLSLPLTMMRVALVVQAQVTRVFWLLDFAMAAYLAWWLLDQVAIARPRVRAAILVVLAAASAGRGMYLVARPDSGRQLVQIGLPDSPWNEAMHWLKGQPSSWYVLADPGHAWKYGVSVRLAAEKDTLLEAGKDTALAMYDRRVAMSVGERMGALSDFDRLSTAAARALRVRYGLDVVIVERPRPLELPVLHENAQFVVYDLR